MKPGDGVDLDSVDLAGVDTKLADAAGPAAPGGGAALAAPVDAPDMAAEWAQLPEMFFALVEDELPELKATYTPERCRKWGEAMIPIAKKYGWTPDAFLAWLGPWVMLSIASHRLVTPTVKVVAVRIRQYREEAKQAAAEQSQPVA
jgi:hypothetical protein